MVSEKILSTAMMGTFFKEMVVLPIAQWRMATSANRAHLYFLRLQLLIRVDAIRFLASHSGLTIGVPLPLSSIPLSTTIQVTNLKVKCQ